MRTNPFSSPGWNLPFAAAIWICLNISGGLVLARRLDGAFTTHVSTSAYCVLMLVVTALAVVAHLLAAEFGGERSSRNLRVAAAGLCFLPWLLWGIGLFPQSWAGGAVLIGYGLLAATPVLFSAQMISRIQDGCLQIGQRLEFAPATLPAASGSGMPDHRANSGNVSQWMTRTEDADGTIRVEGGMVAEFLPRERQTTVHLAFCPPFAQTPGVTCDPAEDAPVRVKIGAVYPYGVRFEVKRTGDVTEPASVPLRFAALSGPAPAS